MNKRPKININDMKRALLYQRYVVFYKQKSYKSKM